MASFLSPRLRLFALVAGPAILLVAVGWLAWHQLTRNHASPPADLPALLQVTNRGIGLLEQFRYPEAVPAPEESGLVDPQGAPPGERRVVRGASWYDGPGTLETTDRRCRAAYWGACEIPSRRFNRFGFRVVCEVD